MTHEQLVALVREAALAPSVHNVQPARWRIGDKSVTLFDDTRCRLAVGDARGNDAAISLGAAAEGLRLAAARTGVSLDEHDASDPPPKPFLNPVTHFAVVAGRGGDPLTDHIGARQSWRGPFVPPSEEDRATARRLESGDASVVADPKLLSDVAQLYDQASFGFMQRNDFRRELVSWMRFSRAHPRWNFDGLNADAMNMNKVAAFGASLVLGPLFNVFDRFGLAKLLTAEGGKIEQCAAVVVFHRPADEDAFVSGGHFYRCWLKITAAGFSAAVLAALADDHEIARKLGDLVRMPQDRRIVSAFRVGRRPPGAAIPRARRPMDELLV
ncbi:MAG: hypothetical protein ACKVRO_08425 [Micropepsaceae bacterium]